MLQTVCIIGYFCILYSMQFCLAVPHAAILLRPIIYSIFQTPMQCCNCIKSMTQAKNILVIFRRNRIHPAWLTFDLTLSFRVLETLPPDRLLIPKAKAKGVDAVINVCAWQHECISVCVAVLMLAVFLWMAPLWHPNSYCLSNRGRNNPAIPFLPINTFPHIDCFAPSLSNILDTHAETQLYVVKYTLLRLRS